MSFQEAININNEINRSFSINEELNPIVVQLMEFGYDNIYSRRVFHYFHPDDLEEALNYMAVENNIIQHRFIKDNRNKNNQLCYICGEKEEIHLKELNFFVRSINSNNNSEISNSNKNNIEQNNNNFFDEEKSPQEKGTNNAQNNLENNENPKNNENIKENNNLNNNSQNIELPIKNINIGTKYLNSSNSSNNSNNSININNIKNSKILKASEEKDIQEEEDMNISFNFIKNINKDMNNTTNNSNKNSKNINNNRKINYELKENEKKLPSENSSESFSFKNTRKIPQNSSSEREYLNHSTNSKTSKANTKKINNENMNNLDEIKNGEIILNVSVKSINNENKNDNLKKDFTIEKEDNNNEIKKECPVCGDEFLVNKKNTVKECGHSFCNGCWYDFLSIKIKENKLPSIKCLDFKCESKLNDEFIISLLNSEINLIKKYKKYKLELEVINDPNKKLCPFPNCNSFLQLKDIKNQYVFCENNHTYCFECLQEPHGNLPCNEKMDKNIIEYAKNNFVKKCPNCSIITEKQNGCNHITCAKCQYQWCWLCNKKYENNHFNEGKCKGFQFFKPKNEYEIKLMMEGKINSDELSESQRQDDEIEDDFHMFMLRMLMLNLDLDINSSSDNNTNTDTNTNEDSFESSRRSNNNNIPQKPDDQDEFDNIKLWIKIAYTIIFIFFGNVIFIMRKYQLDYRSRYFYIYLLLNISLFFPLIFLNIISFVFIIIFKGFKKFIVTIHFTRYHFYTKEAILIIANLFLGIFLKFYFKWKELIHDTYILNKRLENIIAFFPSFITLFVIFFPNIIFYNFIYMIILFIKEGSFFSFLFELDSIFENSFNFKIRELNYIK